jgi:hypothetical protein
LALKYPLKHGLLKISIDGCPSMSQLQTSISMGDFGAMQLSHGTKGVAHKTLGIITRRGRLFGQQTFAVNPLTRNPKWLVP